jgi:C4-type Zn-finger protein
MKNAWEQVVTAFMSSEAIITIVNFLSSGFSAIADVIGGIGSPLQVTTVALVGLTAALGLYTVAKYKAAAAEEFANAQGALTAMQLLKLNVLRYSSIAAITIEELQLKAKNTTMGQAIMLAGTAMMTRLKEIILSKIYAGQLSKEAILNMAKNTTLMDTLVIGAVEIAQKSRKLAITTMQIIKDKIKLAIDKLGLLFATLRNSAEAVGNSIKKKGILLTLKDIAVKAALVIWNGILTVVNFVLASSFLALAISIAATLFFLLPFIAAGVAFVAIAYLLVTAFIEASRSVDSYGKSIAKANARMRELATKEKNIKTLTDRFKELDSQVSKSVEDLDEMKSIAEELGEVTVGDETFNLMTEDAFGNAIINQEEYSKYLAASAKEREKLLKQEQKEFNAAIRKFGADAFDNEAVENSARRLGYRMVEGLIEGIEDADLQKQVDDSIKASLARVDMSVFINAKGNFDNDALKNFTEEQVEIFKNLFIDIQTLSEVEGAAIESGTDAVTARVDAINSSIEAYKDALNEIETSDLTDEQKDELEMALNLTFSGEAGLLELIEERSLSVEVIAELSLRGMDNNEIAAFISRQIRPATELAQEEAFAGSSGFESTDVEAERARLQAERDAIVDTGGSRYKTGKAAMQK